MLDEKEWRIIINSLNDLRNKLLAEGRYTDAVDDVLLRVTDAPIRKLKMADSKRDVADLLGEDAEVRSVRERLRQRQQEQTQQRQKRQKRHGQERKL